MVNECSGETPTLRAAHEKLSDMLSRIDDYPALRACEDELRSVCDTLRGAMSPTPTDLEMRTKVLDAMYALVDEVAAMPVPIKRCVALAVTSYVSEQMVYHLSLRLSRPFTDEERLFGKERLGGLLDRLLAILKSDENA